VNRQRPRGVPWGVISTHGAQADLHGGASREYRALDGEGAVQEWRMVEGMVDERRMWLSHISGLLMCR
jgi:hypothetical protein